MCKKNASWSQTQRAPGTLQALSSRSARADGNVCPLWWASTGRLLLCLLSRGHWQGPWGLQRPSLAWPTLPASPPRSRSRNTRSYRAQQMPCNTLTCLQLTTPWISRCGCYRKPQTFDIRTFLSQTLCFGSPLWACPSRQDGVGIATVKWRKVVKLFYARCAVVNLGWQEAHSGQFLCPVQQAMTFSDCKHDPTHLKDNFSHRLNCINLLSEKIKSSLVFFSIAQLTIVSLSMF